MIAKSKKSLVFAELISEFLEGGENESLIDDKLFIIDSSNQWYSDTIKYLQDMRFPSDFSHENQRCIKKNAQSYLIIKKHVISPRGRYSVITMLHSW